MNAVVSDDAEVPEPVEGPGKRLKTERERKGLELANVASMLHLSEGKLEALEADDYQALSGSVFTQGYLRNYARLLEVSVDEVLDAYHQLNPVDDRVPDLKVGQVRREMRSSHGLVRMITWIIVLGLLGLVLTWWQGYLKWPTPGDAVMSEPATNESEIGEPVPDEMLDDKPLGDLVSENRTSLTRVENGQAMLALPEAPAIETAPQGQMPEATETVMANGQTEPEGGASSEEIPSVTATSEAEQDARPEPVTEPGSQAVTQGASGEIAGRVELSFSGDCWVNIRDASGSFRLAGTQRAGSSRTLGGTPPYKFVLGNADVVTLLVDGETYDLAPHTNGNVAKFTLELE